MRVSPIVSSRFQWAGKTLRHVDMVAPRHFEPARWLETHTRTGDGFCALLEISCAQSQVLVLISLLSTKLRLTRCTPSANRQAAGWNSNFETPYSCGVMPPQTTPK